MELLINLIPATLTRRTFNDQASKLAASTALPLPIVKMASKAAKIDLCQRIDKDFIRSSIRNLTQYLTQTVFADRESDIIAARTLSHDRPTAATTIMARQLHEARSNEGFLDRLALFTSLTPEDSEKLNETELTELVRNSIGLERQSSAGVQLNPNEEKDQFDLALSIAEIVNDGDTEMLGIMSKWLDLASKARGKMLLSLAKSCLKSGAAIRDPKNQFNKDLSNLFSAKDIDNTERQSILTYIKLRESSSQLSALMQMIRVEKNPKLIQAKLKSLTEFTDCDAKDLSELVKTLRKEKREILVKGSTHNQILVVNPNQIHKVVKRALDRLKCFSGDYRKENFENRDDVDFNSSQDQLKEYQKAIEAIII